MRGVILRTDDLTEFGVHALVQVIVYPSRWSMLDAAYRFNGAENPADTSAVTQYMEIGGEPWPIIRFAAERLTTEIVAHELHHATTCLYARAAEKQGWGIEVLHHANEPFAYLYGHMFTMLTRWLYRQNLWR